MELAQKTLKKLGLSNNEIEVYLAGLRLGPAKASQIAKQAKLSRPLVYTIIDSLQTKGLVSKGGPAYRTLFAMESPARLQELLTRKVKELQDMGPDMTSLQAALMSSYTPTIKPSRVRFYEGTEGVKTAVEEIFSAPGKEMMALVPGQQNIFQLLDQTYIDYWNKRREKHKIKGRSIWSIKPQSPLLRSQFQQMRLAPSEFNIAVTIVLYDNKSIFFTSPMEPTVLVVEGDEFTKTLKSMFEIIWAQSTAV